MSGRRDAAALLRLQVLVSVGLLVVAVVAALTATFLLARSEARMDAESRTRHLAQFVVGPLLSRSLAGDLQAADELDRLVRFRLSHDDDLQRMVAWRRDGTVVWSSDPGLIGRRLTPEEPLDPVADGAVRSEIRVDDNPADADERSGAVEVYTPMSTAGGVMVLEACWEPDLVAAQTRTIAWPMIGPAVLPLILLQVVQLPITVSLIRRIRRSDREKAALLERALDASDRERREIAAGLHDTVVQDLAGASYAMSSLEWDLPESRRPAAAAVLDTMHRSVAQLRRLMVDIYPPNLSCAGLEGTLGELVRPLRQRGVLATVSVDPLPDVPEETTAALYRAAREGLANVVKHSAAGTVHVALTRSDDDVTLVVEDDGIGAPADALARPADGHMGIRLVRDRVRDLGGELDVVPRPDGGTALCVRVPLPGVAVPGGRPPHGDQGPVGEGPRSLIGPAAAPAHSGGRSTGWLRGHRRHGGTHDPGDEHA